jgi:hypothetical protein
MSEIIRIQIPEIKAENFKSTVPVRLDLPGGSHVEVGIQLRRQGVDRAEIEVPHSPHLMTFDQIDLFDQKHKPARLNQITAIVGHAIRYTEPGSDKQRWTFDDGQEVVIVVKTYNDYAKQNNLPQLELVVACNPDPIGEKEAPMVRIVDFPAESGVIQAVGDNTRHALWLKDSGEVQGELITQRNFANLDEILDKNQSNGANPAGI